MTELVGDVLVFKRRRPDPPVEQAEDKDSRAVRVGQLVLQTFEHRRTQLTTKSTICATAASGVIVLTIQIFLADPATEPPVRALGFVAMACAALALLQGLNVIKKLSRRTRSKRSRSHLLFFGSYVEMDSGQAFERIVNVTEEEYIRELATQIVELSRNLRARYDALGRAYVWLTIAVIAFTVTLGVQQVYLFMSS